MYGYLINVLVTAVTAAVVFAVWVTNRRRIAAEARPDQQRVLLSPPLLLALRLASLA